MTKVDYIIVGCGLAGIAFCEQLRKQNKSFLVIDDSSQHSSKVAGGIYNPVVLKRFTSAWKADELLGALPKFYSDLEAYLNIKLDVKIPVLRAFTSAEEQNNWFTASDQPLLSKFLSLNIRQNTNPHINANFGLGEVLGTGKIDTKQLVESYTNRLDNEKSLLQQSFNFNDLVIEKDHLRYNNIQAKYMVFAEGFGLKKNPHFNYLPLRGSKGEYLTIKAPELKLKVVLKTAIFIIPLGADLYLIGATYDNDDKTNTPSKIKEQELLRKLQNSISCDFNVVHHVAGIRPTVKDRRPLVGKHPQFQNLAVLNGLGTRGVMLAPYIAKQLFDNIENEKSLDPEIDVQRYKHLFIG